MPRESTQLSPSLTPTLGTWKPPKGKVVANVQLRRRHASASFSGIWRSYYMNNMSIVIEMRERKRGRGSRVIACRITIATVLCAPASACGGRRTIGMGKERDRERPYSTGSLEKLFTGTEDVTPQRCVRCERRNISASYSRSLWNV